MPDQTHNIDEDKPWSESDVADLKICLEQKTPIPEIADFLCRREDEIEAKIRELGLSH